MKITIKELKLLVAEAFGGSDRLRNPQINDPDRNEAVKRYQWGQVWGLRVERVKISELIPTQPKIDATNAQKLLGLKVAGRPTVVIHKGNKYLLDGHHRVVNAALRGDEYIDVDVVHTMDE